MSSGAGRWGKTLALLLSYCFPRHPASSHSLAPRASLSRVSAFGVALSAATKASATMSVWAATAILAEHIPLSVRHRTLSTSVRAARQAVKEGSGTML